MVVYRAGAFKLSDCLPGKQFFPGGPGGWETLWTALAEQGGLRGGGWSCLPSLLWGSTEHVGGLGFLSFLIHQSTPTLLTTHLSHLSGLDHGGSTVSIGNNNKDNLY